MVDRSSPVADNPFGTAAGQGVVAAQDNSQPAMTEHADAGGWSQVGQATQRFGNTSEEVAQHYGEMAVHTQVNDQYVNGYAPQVNSIVSDYKKLQGMDAVSQQPVYEKKIQDLNKQYLSSGSPMSQELMGGLVARHTISTMDTISNHADQQYSAHETIVTQQSIKNASDEAMNNWQNPEMVDYNVNRAIGLSKLEYGRKVGYDSQSQEVVDQLSKEQGSHVVTSAINMALDNKDYIAANAYKNKYSDILSGKDKLSVEKKVSDLSISNNASYITDNLFGGKPAIPAGTVQYQSTQVKAGVAELAQKENFDPNIAFALHGAESDYGKGIKDTTRLKDDFQTDPRFRDKGFEGDDIASSMHNAVKIWNANGTELQRIAGGTAPTIGERYLAYNQGGAGAHVLLSADTTETAVQALSKIMKPKDALAHVQQNGGTATMSAADFSDQIQQRFMNHYDTQKVTVEGNPAAAIRDHANVQLPAVQQASNPHDYFKQINDRLPAAQAYADTIPDDKTREAVQKNIKLKYEQARLGDTAWKEQQAQVVDEYAKDSRYTSMDQIPVTTKENLRESGGLGALEKLFNDKNNPRKDKIFGSGFLQSMGKMATDDPVDSISNMAGLQKEFADNPNLHSSGFKALAGLAKNIASPDGHAQIASQYQYLSDLSEKMTAAQLESALPKFFGAYGDAQAKGTLSDFLSLDPKNSKSFAASLNLPSSAELTGHKIQETSKWLTSLSHGEDTFSGIADGNLAAQPTSAQQQVFTPAEKIVADFHDGIITAAQKDAQLRALGIGPSVKVPRPL